MSASDWLFNIRIWGAVAVTIAAGVKFGLWPFVACAVLTGLYIWNGCRSRPCEPTPLDRNGVNGY